MIKDIETILASVKEYYARRIETGVVEEAIPAIEDLEELKFNVPTTPARSFVCVDGSFSNLIYLQDLDSNITIFRVSTLEYRFDSIGRPILARHHVYDKVKLVSANARFNRTDPTLTDVVRIASRFEGRELDIVASMIMYIIEQKALLAAARRYKNAILARDGALTVFFLPELKHLMEEVLAHCTKNENILVGISKDSTSHYLDKTLVDEAVLSAHYESRINKAGGPQVAVRIAPERVRRHHKFEIYGDVYFARLNPFAEKFFRVDIGTPKDQAPMVFGEIAKYCTWEATPGFPFPLVEAHKSAKAVRDVKEFYVDQVINAWKQYGIPREVLLNGLLDKFGIAAGKFHSKLDLISRV